jgi:hypothetical protein
MQRIEEPFGAPAPICGAQAKVAPAEMPTKNAFLLCQVAAATQCIGVGDARDLVDDSQTTTSPVGFGMKSGVQPRVGCVLTAGWAIVGEPSFLRYCCVQLVSNGASKGSLTTILVSGRSFASTRATPLRVPPYHIR